MTEAYDGPGIMVNSGPIRRQTRARGVGQRSIAWLAETGPRRGGGQLPPARLADLPPALLGHADPDRLLRRVRHGAGAGRPAAGRAAGRCGVHCRPANRRWSRTRASSTRPARSVADRRAARPTRWTHSSTRPGTGSATLSPQYDREPSIQAAVASWTPVDLYCGGIEHAILHLLYARFFTKVMRDLGLIEQGEPYLRLRNQGMILAEEGTKMSKSRGTQVAPDKLVAEHGADALRLHLMYLGPWEQGGPWNSRGITGMERFIKRAFALVTTTGSGPFDQPLPDAETAPLRRLRARTIQRVEKDLDEFQFNTMVAWLIEYVNELMRLRETPLVRTPEWRRRWRRWSS